VARLAQNGDPNNPPQFIMKLDHATIVHRELEAARIPLLIVGLGEGRGPPFGVGAIGCTQMANLSST